MKRKVGLLYLIVLTSGFLFLQLNCSQDKSQNQSMTKEESIARGNYLVNFGGCNDCHTPKKGFDEKGPILDTTRLLSGHPADQPIDKVDTTSKWLSGNMSLTAWAGPWGVSYTANLTPDGATGLGNWTEDIFMKAMKTGKHMGYGRPILPPMPWFSVGSLKDEDLKAIFSYLKSLKPVSNKVPDPVPPNMISQLNNRSTQKPQMK